MANQATTTYKVTGTRKAVNDLWSTLQKMEVNSKNIWLYQLAEHYGIDYETKQISVRGHCLVIVLIIIVVSLPCVCHVTLVREDDVTLL